MEVVNIFDAYLADVEYTVKVPKEYGGADESDIRIGMSAVGGGTVGESYRDNAWIWGVWSDGELVLSAADLRSPVAVGATHPEMIRTLCSFLAHDGDVIACGGEIEGESYTPAQAEFLGYNNERIWACSTGAYEEHQRVREFAPEPWEVTDGLGDSTYGE